ncbi:MAG: SEC-C domain-containing protein [Acidobacteriia bacterium]|nr:SEC-C domain-containing protein [Terriglobia bacterium]
MKTGRNNPCPCGSGLKYKKCHGRPGPATAARPASKVQSFSLRERNLTLLAAIVDIFGMASARGWDEVKENVSDDRVRELYRVVAGLWPPDTDVGSLFPTPGPSLRALYLGDVNPEQIVHNVFRFALYADEIFIVDPFHNPWLMAREYSPLVNPGQWKMDTLKLVYFMAGLAPWIEAGLVTLIPNPGHFDYPLLRKTWNLAKERLAGWKPSEEDMEDFEPAARQEFARVLFALPRGTLARKLRDASPEISEQDIGKTLDYIDALRRRDPLDLAQPIEKLGEQTVATRTGANLEMALYISQLTGAFPYTSLRMRWKELLSVAEELPDVAQVWSPLTKAFQELEFKFLDQVDSEFACSLRKDGRLEGFRAFLRRVWSMIGGAPDISRASSLARDFGDELTSEYHKAEAEWGQIDRDLVKQFGATFAGGLISGAFSLHIPTLGFAVAGVVELLNARLKRREFRKRVPMSVLIDLSARKNRKMHG